MKRACIGFVTCTVLTFSVAAVAKNSIPNQGNKPTSHNGESRNQQTNPPKAIPLKPEQDIKPEPPPAEERNKTIYESKTETDWWARIANGLMAVGTLTLAFIGWLGVCAAVRTLKAIERQAEIMENQRKSVAGKERPRIAIELANPTFDDGVTGLVQLKIDCQCPTPAFIDIDGGQACVDSEGKAFPHVTDYFPLAMPKQIYTSIQFERFFPIYKENQGTTVHVESLRSKELFLYCRGVIEYRGVHLLDNEGPYKTPFSKRWIAEETPIFGLGDGYWEDYPSAEENHRT